MAKTIEPNLRKIGEYLKLENDTTFIIPEYQRPYSWSIANCDKLWQDIVVYIVEGNKDRYFFGTIIINCQDNDSKYSLIDGQQRTTTFLLLLKALLMKINIEINKCTQDEESAALCRGLRDRRRTIMKLLYKVEAEEVSDSPDKLQDGEIYKKVCILKNNSINENDSYKGELNTLLKAVDFDDAEKNVVKIKYKQKDNKYTNFFRNFKYFYGKICELSPSQLNNITKVFIENCEVIEIKSWNVEQAIRMFNSLNSDGLPLSDADIISAEFYSSSERMKKGEEFSELWRDLCDKVNSLEEIDIDSILAQYMYYMRAKNKDILSSTGAINVTVPGVRRYFKEINRDLIDRFPVETCQEMITLAKNWDVALKQPIVKILLKFNENAKLFFGGFLLRFDENNIDEQQITLLAETMIRLFAVLELVDTGYSSSKFKTFLFGEMVKFVDKSILVHEIIDDFDCHINKNWKKEDIEKSIYDSEKNILVFLNEYLFAKERKEDFKFKEKCDIEHIMPSSGRNLSEIRKDAQLLSDEEFIGYVNKLGNKILLEYKINRGIGNEWFRTKVSTTLASKTGYVNSSYGIAKYLVEKYRTADKPFWTKNDIDLASKEASKRIVEFIYNIANI